MKGRSDDVEFAKDIFLSCFRVDACLLFREANSPSSVWTFSGLSFLSFTLLSFFFCAAFTLSFLLLFYPFGAKPIDTRTGNLPRGTLDPLRTDPDSASTAVQVLANVSQLPSRARRSSELNGPQRYTKMFRKLLTSSFFPLWGAPRRPG